MQSKIHSLIESLTNVIVGIVVSIAGQILIFPMFGIYIPFTDNLLIAMCFTVISIARSYAIRRWFTRRT